MFGLPELPQRWSGDWGEPQPGPRRPAVEVLVPTYRRPSELAVTLSGLAAQTGVTFDVIVSDQGDEPSWEQPAVAAMVRVLRAQGHGIRLEHHLPRRGLAEQRDYLLSLAHAPHVLYLDDDVWLEPGMLARLKEALDESECGLVGAAVQGLSHLEDRRPHEWETFELWEGPPRPERIPRHSQAFERWRLHNAANLSHVAAGLKLTPGDWRLYKIAWVGGCVLFDRRRLLEVGGFGFWDRLPPEHAGEDVVAQTRVMAAYGGAGIIPSGAVHLEAPTTVTERSTEAADFLGVRPEA